MEVEYFQSLCKTLIFCLFLRVLPKPLAWELQTRKTKEGVCLPALSQPRGVFLCCSWTLCSPCPGTEQDFFPKPPTQDLFRGGAGTRRSDNGFQPVLPMERVASYGDAVPDLSGQPEGAREGSSEAPGASWVPPGFHAGHLPTSCALRAPPRGAIVLPFWPREREQRPGPKPLLGWGLVIKA